MQAPYHIYFDTAEGRKPFTYLVFGPYDGLFDVEVHQGHIDQYNPADDWSYLFTVSDLPRDSHICADMWDAMVEFLNGYSLEV